ncbi:MAG: hypothetical protein ABI867_23800 [Kofleriaceae bacterium]
MSFREDWIIRMIRQFTEALARIAGLRKAGDLREAEQAADRLYEELGIPRELTTVVDTPTLAGMLKVPEKIRCAALLQWEEGHLLKAKGDPLHAHRKYKRAHELFLEARALDPQPDDDSAILELSRIVPARDLDPKYRGDISDE